LQKLILGGSDYGHHTLTRFFALHAGVLPGAIIALLVADAVKSASRKRRQARDREGQRRKHWGYT
jgi:quinol-cytochrome oxidoreductase complex cytochrome b subunit